MIRRGARADEGRPQAAEQKAAAAHLRQQKNDGASATVTVAFVK